MTPERWRRIEELFHAASERGTEERDAFLERECTGDVGLRHEVDSLLAQQNGTLLSEGVAAAATGLVGAPTRGTQEGRRLGPYVLGPILGMGGMGDVYRARDETLNRDVAVKILPEALARHPERLARFGREARALAALNHPNIGAIYGLEESDGLRGLVLELVDGVTLKEKLASGALGLDKALAIARQIAAALEAAHRKGIVHRDLKPANIQIDSRDHVKVLDFGLAKIETSEMAEPGGMPVLATGDGVVLGTVAYMSPEQARGLAVDKRTDIWAFGCVLYEMLTGVRAFPGESAADVLGAITSAEPEWARLPPDIPDGVRRLLRRCLAKEPDRRLHDVADARIEIDDHDDADPAANGIGPSGSRVYRALVPWVLSAVMAAAAAGAIWFAVTARPLESRSLARLAIPLPPEVSVYAIGRGSSVAVSPDGQRIVYVGLVRGRRQLYIRSLDGLDSVAISGTENAANPFFSPDGRWIGFTDAVPQGTLKKVPVEGGAPVTLLERTGDGLRGFAVQGASWAPDDTIVFTAVNPRVRGLWRIAASGGTPQRLTTVREGELGHSWPQMVPGRHAVLYTIWNNTGFGGGRIVVQPLPGGEPTILVEGGSYGRIVVDGDGRAWLVYARPESLLAAPFDLDRLQLAGQAVPVLSGVLTNLSGGAHFASSPAGVLVYVPGELNETIKTAVWIDRTGKATEIGRIPGLGFQYRLSPDGRRLARPEAVGPSRDLYVENLETQETPARLTFGATTNSPVWTWDGKRIIYAKGAPKANLFWKAADGSGDEERLTTSKNGQIPGSVSRDGKTLAYVEDDPDSGSDIWLLSLGETRAPRLLVGTPGAELYPMISPDGRWLAYKSIMSGKFEIYLVSLSGDGRQHPVSKGGGHNPLWSPDGRELYYRSDIPERRGDMMVVSIDTRGREPKIGTPRLLFQSPYQGEGDIAPDGRFLLLKPTPEESPSRVIQVVFNWFRDLQVRVAAR